MEKRANMPQKKKMTSPLRKTISRKNTDNTMESEESSRHHIRKHLVLLNTRSRTLECLTFPSPRGNQSSFSFQYKNITAGILILSCDKG